MVGVRLALVETGVPVLWEFGMQRQVLVIQVVQVRGSGGVEIHFPFVLSRIYLAVAR